MLSVIYSGNPVKISKFLILKHNLNYNLVNKLLRNNDIRINDVKINSDIIINNGDKVVVYYDEKKFDFKEIYKDNNILIIYKPKGITSEGDNSAEELLSKKYSYIKLCHRIDTNTDGLLLFALNEKSYNEIYSSLAEQKISKFYYALCYKCPEKDSDVLKDFIYKDSEKAIVKISNKKISDDWQQIITEYKVIKKFDDYSLLLITLHTGKTHQIRAHLAFYGYPILGDSKYGTEEINNKFKFKKQQLTFFKMTFNFDTKSPLFYLNTKVIELDNNLISCIKGIM